MMIFATYEQWRDTEMKYMLEANPVVPCQECNGMGTTECDDCGQDRECPECEGAEEIRFSELDEYERKKLLTKERYEEALLVDAGALARWVGSEITDLLVRLGFTPWVGLIYQRTNNEVTGFQAGKFHALR